MHCQGIQQKIRILQNIQMEPINFNWIQICGLIIDSECFKDSQSLYIGQK